MLEYISLMTMHHAGTNQHMEILNVLFEDVSHINPEICRNWNQQNEQYYFQNTTQTDA